MEILNQLYLWLTSAFHNALSFDWGTANYKTGSLIAKTAVILAAVFLLKIILKLPCIKEILNIKLFRIFANQLRHLLGHDLTEWTFEI